MNTEEMIATVIKLLDARDEKLYRHLDEQFDLTRANSSRLAARVENVVNAALNSNERIRTINDHLEHLKLEVSQLKRETRRPDPHTNGNGNGAE